MNLHLESVRAPAVLTRIILVLQEGRNVRLDYGPPLASCVVFAFPPIIRVEMCSLPALHLCVCTQVLECSGV